MDRIAPLEQGVIDALSAYIVVVDQAGKIIAANQAWQRLADPSGTQAGTSLCGADYLDLCSQMAYWIMPPFDLAAGAIATVRSGAQAAISLEYPCQCVAEEHWYLLEAARLPLPSRGLVVTHWDISRFKAQERRVAYDRDMWRTIVDTLPDYIFVKDLEQRYLLVNQAYADYLGETTPSAVVGKTVFDFFPPALAEKYQADDLAVLRAGQKLTGYEEPSVDRDGNHQFHLATKWPLYANTGELCGLVGIGRDITEGRLAEAEKSRLLAEITEQRSQLRTLSARLAQSQEAQRRQIVRELHDHVGQNLTALGFTLKLIQRQIAGEVAEGQPLAQHLGEAMKLATQTTEALRSLMTELRPPVLDDYGLIVALRWYGKQVTNRSGLQVVVYDDPFDHRLPEAVESALFRIAQEAINNTLKHGAATQVTVTMVHTTLHVRLAIADNGIGFDPQAVDLAQSGWGLLNMRERAEAAGGHCHIISQPGAGTTVIVEVPK